MSRDLKWTGSGTVSESLGVTTERARQFEDFVRDAVKARWSLQELITGANADLDMTDAEWTVFMFGLGYWEASRGR